MSIKAILFDLDGTLLAQNQDVFIGAYFKELISALSPLGVSAGELEAAIWKSVGAMVKNDGSKTNERVFFDTFSKICNVDMKAFERLATEFYLTEYKKLKKYTSPSPLSKKAVEYAKQGGRAVVLATNPLFPMIAQAARIEFAGLDCEDFLFVTSYERESYSKPNPLYYTSIAKRLGVLPCECLMIGNDEREDMFAASSAGMKCFLIEDCMIACEEHPWGGARGSFSDFVEWIKNK